MKVFTPEPVDKKGWTRWIRPKRRGYKLCCCDCGLIHDTQFRLRPSPNGGRYIEYRAKRNNGATTAQRRHIKRGS